MRLLYVTDQVPNIDPVHGDGSALISYQLLRHLSDDVEVDLLTFAWGPPMPEEVAARVRSVTYLPLRSQRAGLLSSLRRASHVSAEQRRTLAGLAVFSKHESRADVTLVHGPFLIDFAARSRGPALFQIIDPSSFWQAHEAARTASPALAGYRRVKTARTLARERNLPWSVLHATVNDAEARAWAERLGRRVVALPNGVSAGAPATRLASADPTVCFLGSLSFAPNVEAATELVTEIAPLVWQHHPGARFVLAGRRPVPEVLALAGPQVEIAANVPDMGEVLARSDVAVFPDRQGYGTRNCVSEALAAGLPVVATELAARGQEPGPSLRVGRTAEDIAGLVCDALEHRDRPAPPVARTWTQAAQEYEQVLRELAGS